MQGQALTAGNDDYAGCAGAGLLLAIGVSGREIHWKKGCDLNPKQRVEDWGKTRREQASGKGPNDVVRKSRSHIRKQKAASRMEASTQGALLGPVHKRPAARQATPARSLANISSVPSTRLMLRRCS